MSKHLITSIDMKLSTPDCHPGADWYNVVVDLQDDITEVLGYLNAELKDADYNHKAKVLLWKSSGKKYAFRPNEIVITPVEDKEEAHQLVDDIICTVNNIWVRREEIEPNFEGKKPPPKVLDIYKLLQRTNCKECGFPSCMAFAAVLRNDSAKLPLCPYISEKDYMSLVS